MSLLGYCPVCGDDGYTRERRPGGNDKCANGHVYPTHLRFIHQPTQEQLDAYKLGGFTRPIGTKPFRVGALVFAVASHARAEALIPLVTSFPQPEHDGVRVIPFGDSARTFVSRRSQEFRALVVIGPRDDDAVSAADFEAWVQFSIRPYLAPDAPVVFL